MDRLDARRVVPLLERGQLAVGKGPEDGREREALGPGVVERLEHVVRDAGADHREQRRRRHRQSEPERRLVRRLE